MVKVSFLSGKSVSLRPLYDKDIEGPYMAWFNDAEVCIGNSHHVYPYSIKNARDYIEYASHARDAIVLAIELKEKGGHIGNIALQNINWINRSADLSIILGDKTQWGKGYGFEASCLLVAHGFLGCNLNRIGCATFDGNIGMKKLACALGMSEEGIRRQAVFKNGKYLDVVEFGLLKHEFNSE
jgi:ribosomal-protein-alanine N-acetyltransferase